MIFYPGFSIQWVFRLLKAWILVLFGFSAIIAFYGIGGILEFRLVFRHHRFLQHRQDNNFSSSLGYWILKRLF